MNEKQFKAKLNYFRDLIDGDLDGQLVVPKGYLEQAVREHGADFNLSEQEVQRFVKHLETVYGTTQEDGHILKKNFSEWYTQEKKSIDFHYWKRLKTFWIEKTVLPKAVVNSVDSVTDEIMGFLGNPKDKETWNRRRGLVMGHVQMGKTTNYSALISKAADSGYRIIIVLAGLTNSLRYQTQVRLDKTFVGKSSVSDATHTKIYEVASILGFGDKNYRARHPFCGTSQLSDFNTATAGAVGAHQGTFAEPILFVTKKNPKVLAKITDWLKGLNNGAPLDGPMLVIDDEADNASVNTNANPDQTTAINRNIRLLLNTTKQSTYIGYTATPFANIFIDPDSAEDMTKEVNEDLFPADFIKSLDPPDNYVGSQRLFTDEGDLLHACVRVIPNDYTELLPLKHKSHHPVAQLPDSLKDAVKEYVLFRAIRLADGNGTSHSAMLINVSRFNHVQEQVQEKVNDLLNSLADAINSWSRADWKKSPAMKDLHRIWQAEFEGTEGLNVNWDQTRSQLVDAIKTIETKLVNMKGSGVDYEKAPPAGLHLIGIGGLALARGLTLEGLAISYVLRNVGAADTLLQMGRWFGYRPGFEKLCRIHATQDLIDDFAAVSESVEELRTDFQRMAFLNKTPYEFGLKVRQSPTGIAITAANKMRTAKEISLAEDFSTRHIQAHSLHDDVTKNQKNIELAQAFINHLKKAHNDSFEINSERKAIVWKKIPSASILKFIKSMSFPQTEFDMLSSDDSSLLTSYIEDRIGTELHEWDVGVPYITTEKSDSVPLPIETGGPAYCRSRSGTKRVSDTVVKVNEKNAVAFGTSDFYLGEDPSSYEARIDQVVSEAMAAAYAAGEKNPQKPSSTWAHTKARSRPLLLLHFLQLDPDKDFVMKLPKNQPIASLGILLPGTNLACTERRYKASKRLLEMLKDLREETETDEELEDE
jgi:Z1 domain